MIRMTLWTYTTLTDAAVRAIPRTGTNTESRPELGTCCCDPDEGHFHHLRVVYLLSCDEGASSPFIHVPSRAGDPVSS
jgi:hypothetical protein